MLTLSLNEVPRNLDVVEQTAPSLRILFFSTIFPRPHAPNRGIFCLRLCQALRSNGHDVRIISPRTWLERWSKQRHPNGPGELDAFRIDYPRYFYTPRFWRHAYDTFMWRSLGRKLRGALAESRPDWIVSYWSHPDGAVAVRAAREMGIGCAVVVGGSDVLIVARQDARRRQRIAATLNQADVVIARSEHLKNAVVELGVPAEKVQVIHQGIDGDLFSPGDKTAARQTLSIPPEAKMLLFVGNLVPVKAIDVLLKACGNLHGLDVPFDLYLIGSGPCRAALGKLADDLKLSRHIHFVGPKVQNDLPAWYRAADLTVLASHSEGIPNVLRESMACGTPFVATDVGGIREIARPELSRLVRPADPEELALALEEELARVRPAARRPAFDASWSQSAAALTEALRNSERRNTVPPLHRLASGAPRKTAGRSRRLSELAVRIPRRIARAALAWSLPRKWFQVKGESSQKAVYLTFDDGPHPVHTPQVLEALRNSNIRATFFLVGEQAEKYPDLVRRIALEGHGIGHHSYWHDEPSRTSAGALMQEVRQTNEILSRILGFTPVLFRPPKGSVTLRKLHGLIRLGLTIVLWNRDPKDFTLHSPVELQQWFLNHPLRSGDIVLLHDARPVAALAIPEIVAAVREQELEFRPIPGWDRNMKDTPSAFVTSVLSRPGKMLHNG